MSGNKNNLDLMRIIAATLVLFSHSFALLDQRDPLSELWFQTAGGLGVDIFFVISGFLVSRSLIRGSSVWSFTVSRLLRIYPALIVCCMTVALAGAFLTRFTLDSYFSDTQFLRFMFINPLGFWMSYQLPGVFPDNPRPGVVNGSLWTLPVEIRLYVLIAACGLAARFLKLSKRFCVIFAVASVTILTIVFASRLNLDLGGRVSSTSWWRIIPLFCLGAVASAFNLEVRKAMLLGAAVGASIVAYIGFGTSFFLPIYWIAMVCWVLLFAFHLPALTVAADCSYGIYIWGFPIQQLLVFSGVDQPAMLFLLGTPLVFAVGLLSWFVVEKPAMSLKSRLFSTPTLRFGHSTRS